LTRIATERFSSAQVALTEERRAMQPRYLRKRDQRMGL
jgi:hypothetical protein